MDWILERVEQETEHRFLNFYTFHYRVDGKPYPYFVASRHAKEGLFALNEHTRPDGVLILALKQDPEPSVLLIRQFRPPLGRKVIEVPAGLCDEGDADVVASAKREANEETGVRLCDVRLLCPPSPTSSGLSDEMVAVVVGTVDSLGENHREQFEDIEARFVPLKDIPTLLQDESNFIALNVRLALLYLLAKEGIA